MTADLISVRLVDPKGEPLPIANVHLDLNFYIEGRYRYGFILGRTDVAGVCQTTVGEVQKQLDAERQIFLMDYNTSLIECDPYVGIVAPTTAELIEREANRAEAWPNYPSIYVGAENGRVRCIEQKFDLRRGENGLFNLVCEVKPRESR